MIAFTLLIIDERIFPLTIILKKSTILANTFKKGGHFVQPVTIRNVVPEDAEELLAIYTPYILETAITFEIEVPSVQNFKDRIQNISFKYPYLVAVQNNRIIGYAYASAFKERPAYNWSVETSIYMDQSFCGIGIGRILYAELEKILKKQHIYNLCACIAYPNPQSIAFHESLGYQTVAHFHKSGYKFGTWHDMIWMEKSILEHVSSPSPFIPYQSL